MTDEEDHRRIANIIQNFVCAGVLSEEGRNIVCGQLTRLTGTGRTTD